MAEIKGNKVKLQTYLKWGVSNIFGHKEIFENGITRIKIRNK